MTQPTPPSALPFASPSYQFNQTRRSSIDEVQPSHINEAESQPEQDASSAHITRDIVTSSTEEFRPSALNRIATQATQHLFYLTIFSAAIVTIAIPDMAERRKSPYAYFTLSLAFTTLTLLCLSTALDWHEKYIHHQTQRHGANQSERQPLLARA